MMEKNMKSGKPYGEVRGPYDAATGGFKGLRAMQKGAEERTERSNLHPSLKALKIGWLRS